MPNFCVRALVVISTPRQAGDQGTRRQVSPPPHGTASAVRLEGVTSAAWLSPEAVPRRWVPPTTGDTDNEGAQRQMCEPLKVVSWASANERCPIKHSVTGSDEVVFIFGSGRDAFEFAFDAGALRNLLKLGTEALEAMDARANQEQAEEGGAEFTGDRDIQIVLGEPSDGVKVPPKKT